METQNFKELEEMVGRVRSASSSKYIRWPLEVREAVKALIGSGVGFREISKRTGIADESLRQWTGRTNPRGRRRFRRVKVTPQNELLIRLPSGAEVCHLNWNQLKELISEKVI